MASEFDEILDEIKVKSGTNSRTHATFSAVLGLPSNVWRFLAAQSLFSMRLNRWGGRA